MVGLYKVSDGDPWAHHGEGDWHVYPQKQGEFLGQSRRGSLKDPSEIHSLKYSKHEAVVQLGTQYRDDGDK